ncbi:hypothetical protein NXW88_21365 [Bacteroides cellulosilyticus]|nr:hypothetical protein NXW88_21365 [Bacteroides cellulosilyticus]
MTSALLKKNGWQSANIFGKNTHIYVGALRAFKLGAYRGIGIKTINDLATHLFANGDMLKHNKEEGIPLKLNSLTTELRKVWAVIKVEDTENIDPYGYDVTLNP